MGIVTPKIRDAGNIKAFEALMDFVEYKEELAQQIEVFEEKERIRKLESSRATEQDE